MLKAVGPEVSIHNLVPGERYYAFARSRQTDYFRGTFTDYYVNPVGYPMVRFHNTITVYKDMVNYIGDPEKHPHGVYYRIWEGAMPQSYRYYKVCRFTKQQEQELKTRCVLRERRQYERGLTGTTPTGVWLPRDIVREISLKYLTDKKVGCAGRWR